MEDVNKNVKIQPMHGFLSCQLIDYDCMLFLDDFNEESWESRNLELADLNMSMNGFNFFSLNV